MKAMKKLRVWYSKHKTKIWITPHRLDEKTREEFNSGKFVRDNYILLYKLRLTRGKSVHFVASPSLQQIFYSIKLLWNATDGMPYDRHGNPVIMQNFDVVKPKKKSHNKRKSKKVVNK